MNSSFRLKLNIIFLNIKSTLKKKILWFIKKKKWDKAYRFTIQLFFLIKLENGEKKPFFLINERLSSCKFF